MAIVKVTSENFEQIKASDKPVLIDFYADWCMPCRRLAPIIDQIAEECPEYVICKVNVDDEPALASQFGVSSIPTLVVIRNGELYRDTLYQDVCVLYRDGVMETYTAEEFDCAAAMERGAWQAWSFGPMLLDSEGKAMSLFNSVVVNHNPRCGVGYYEPGHYCFVIVEGRNDYSRGATLAEFSYIFEQLGCTVDGEFNITEDYESADIKILCHLADGQLTFKTGYVYLVSHFCFSS